MRRAATVLALLIALATAGPWLSGHAGSAQAQAAQPSDTLDQVPLTAKDVENFLASYGALKTLAQQLEARYGPPESTEEEDPAGAFAGYLRHDKARADIEGVLKRFNFASFEAWSRVASSVVIAYGAIGGEAASGSEGDQSFDKAVEDIRKDPNLTQEQKDKMVAELNQQLGAIEAFRPLPGNVEVVRPFEARLRTLLEDP